MNPRVRDPRHPPSLDVLRSEARDEWNSLAEKYLRLGEDPWDFMDRLPSIDEMVVLLLMWERNDPAHASVTHVEGQRELLRRIATDYPDLRECVWTLSGVTGESLWRALMTRERVW